MEVGGADGREAGGAGGEGAGNKPLAVPLSHTPVPKLVPWRRGRAPGEWGSACSSRVPACAFENMEPVCKDMPRGPAQGPSRPCGQPGECARSARGGPWTRGHTGSETRCLWLVPCSSQGREKGRGLACPACGKWSELVPRMWCSVGGVALVAVSFFLI